MAAHPGLVIWTDAYLADTTHLTDAEHGRYLLLLMLMWRTPGCRIPNDDAWLARHFRRTVGEVKSDLRPIIAEFCKTDGNWIWQKRLKQEHEQRDEKAKTQSVRAKSRWNKNKDLCPDDATPHHPGNATLPYPSLKERKNIPLPLRDEKPDHPDQRTEGAAPKAEDPPDEDPRPPDPELAKPPDAAVEVIAAFDRIRVEVCGPAQARPWPHPRDRPTALRWLAAGADIPLVESVARAALGRQQSAGREPASSLAYLDKPIADALAERSRPMPDGQASAGNGSAAAPPKKGNPVYGTPEWIAREKAMGLMN